MGQLINSSYLDSSQLKFTDDKKAVQFRLFRGHNNKIWLLAPNKFILLVFSLFYVSLKVVDGFADPEDHEALKLLIIS